LSKSSVGDLFPMKQGIPSKCSQSYKFLPGAQVGSNDSSIVTRLGTWALRYSVLCR
jgi:hypothetical protein